MSRKFDQWGWIGLTLMLGMITGVFFPVSTLAQVNSSSSTSDSLSQCNSIQIPLWINQLAVGDVKAFDTLVNCNSIAVPYLIKAIDDENKTIRLASITILGEIGEDAKDAILSLLEIIENESASEKTILATNAIAKMGEDGKEIIHNLVSQNIMALEDKDSYVRYVATDTLGRMGEEAKEAIPALIFALKDEDIYVRSNAAEAIGNMGEEAQKAIPALISALEHENSYFRRYAAEALAKIRGYEDTQYFIIDMDTSQTTTGSLAERIRKNRRENPPVACKFPVIKKILSWKCPKISPTDTVNSPQAPKPATSNTTQPNKKSN